jgi:hypothetical protein
MKVDSDWNKSAIRAVAAFCEIVSAAADHLENCILEKLLEMNSAAEKHLISPKTNRPRAARFASLGAPAA